MFGIASSGKWREIRTRPAARVFKPGASLYHTGVACLEAARRTSRPPVRVPMNRSHDLKTSGLKATLPRLKILDLFETSGVRHMTAEDVYKLLLKEGMDIGLATIYRVLTQFEQAHILIRHHFEGGKAVFELNEGGHHDHLVCVQCGHVEEFYDPEIERRQVKIAKDRGFNLHEHSLQLYADCIKQDCPHRPK
jgi:Fur family ferric uptake transcriptional regulator